MLNGRRIAVLTSGGDVPGMNAAIRSVVRAASARGIETVGVLNGYAGLVEGNFWPLDNRAVGGIIQRGGTMLGSARCPSFRTLEVQQQARSHLAAAGVEGAHRDRRQWVPAGHASIASTGGPSGRSSLNNR